MPQGAVQPLVHRVVLVRAVQGDPHVNAPVVRGEQAVHHLLRDAARAVDELEHGELDPLAGRSRRDQADELVEDRPLRRGRRARSGPRGRVVEDRPVHHRLPDRGRPRLAGGAGCQRPQQRGQAEGHHAQRRT
nr:hypothetical protein [Streptomyces sp. DSM 44938]